MLYWGKQAAEDKAIGLISVSLPSDGTTADVADYNTPITTIVTLVNGNIDNSNIVAGAAIAGSKLADASVTNAKLATGSGQPGGAWTSYTPTFANTTLGNGTVTGAYILIGKTVHFRARFVLGTTSAVASGPTVSLPVTSVALTVDTPLGIAIVLDGGIADYPGTLYWASTTTASPQVTNAAATYGVSNGITATVPITFGSTDNLYVQGTYEAA